MHGGLQNPPLRAHRSQGWFLTSTKAILSETHVVNVQAENMQNAWLASEKMTAFDNTVQTFVPSHLVSETDTCYASVQKRIGHNSHRSTHGWSRFLERHPSPCFALHGRQGWTSAICLLWLVKGGHHATMLAFEDTEIPMCLPKDFNGAPESLAMSHFKNYCFLIFFFQKPSRKHRHEAHTVTAALLAWLVFAVTARKLVTCHQPLNSRYLKTSFNR